MAPVEEVELKLEVDAAGAKALRADPLLAAAPPPETIVQSSTYYDTRKGALRRAGYTLRVRKAQGGFVQTAKTAANGAGLFDRPEWESRVAGPEPDAAALAGTPLATLLTVEVTRKLRPVIVSDVERTIWRVRHGDSEIELALDEGRIAAADETQPLSELELELKDGEASAVFALARSLGGRAPLKLGVLSKAERGQAIAEGRLGRVAKAAPVEVTPAMDVADGFATIVRACLRHFRLNEPLVVSRRMPEALHQARVAMRRLRSALSLFAPALRGAPFEVLRGDLRWFTGKLGDARNLDVFLAGPAAAQVGVGREALEAAREEAYRVVIEALGSQRFRDLMIDLVGWVETGAWRGRRRARRPLPGFAEARLDRLWGRVVEPAAVMASLGEEDRHRLRIEIKKLRYAAEFLVGLYGSRTTARNNVIEALEAMQESLGHLNDMATARMLVGGLTAAAVSGAPVLGSAEVERDEQAHLAEAERSYRKLVLTGPFWR